jgi:hypothetical protein
VPQPFLTPIEEARVFNTVNTLFSQLSQTSKKETEAVAEHSANIIFALNNLRLNS